MLRTAMTNRLQLSKYVQPEKRCLDIQDVASRPASLGEAQLFSLSEAIDAIGKASRTVTISS